MTKPARQPHAADASIGRCLLDLDSLGAEEIRALLRQTRRFAQAPASERFDTLAGRTVANLFFENSTRTRLSFTLATRRLGGEAVDLSSIGSSVGKGETAIDTAKAVEAMGVDVIVIRHSASGAVEMVARSIARPVVNAGDGAHAHPTQGLIDAYTIAEAHHRLDGFDLSGLRVGIVGDAQRSRVARSDIAALTKLGAAVVCIGPPDLAPTSLQTLGCEVSRDLDDALPTLDAVQTLRVQTERGSSVGSIRQFVEVCQLNEKRTARLKPGAVVMHPGPMNRGVEIASAVADGEKSRVWRQVAVGVPARMAVLEAVAGASERILQHRVP